MNDADHTEQEVIYSYTNQPPTVQEATRRLDELDISIARIAADLQTRTERDLGTLDAYDDWKFRATRSLNYRLRERHFLIQWIKWANRQTEEAQKQISNQERVAGFSAMITEFLALATPYKTVFSKENPPTDLRQLMERKAELSDIKLEYEGFVIHLKEESLKIGFPPNFYGGGRGKVTRIVQKVDRELVLLKKFSRIFTSSEVGSLPSPLRTADSSLSSIQQGLQTIKVQLGMGSAEMTTWLFELLIKQRKNLRLKKEQKEKLKLIEQYVQLTLQRRKIQFPE